MSLDHILLGMLRKPTTGYDLPPCASGCTSCGRSSPDLSILGPFNWVPSVAPAIIGTVGGRMWEKSYRCRFGDLPSREERTEAGARA